MTTTFVCRCYLCYLIDPVHCVCFFSLFLSFFQFFSKFTSNKVQQVEPLLFYFGFVGFKFWSGKETTAKNKKRARALRLAEALLEDSLALLLPLVLVHPEVVLVLHDFSEHGTTEEHHVLASRGILNSALELGKVGLVALEDLLEVETTNVLLKTRWQTGVHGRATREDDVVVELWTSIDVGLVDAVEQLITHAATLNVDEVRLKQNLRSLETLSTDVDHAAIRQCVLLDEHSGLVGETLLEFEIVADVAELLLDLTDGLEIGGSVEDVAAEQQQLDQITSDIATGDIETSGQVGQRKTFVDGHNVRDTITRVDDDTSQKTLGVQGQHGLNGDVDRLEAVLLEHDLSHLLAVLLRVHWSLSKHDLALVGLDLELLLKGVVPDVHHIVPVTDHTIVERIGDLQHVADLGGFITNHDVLELDIVNLLLSSEHGATDQRREDGVRKVRAGETALDKSCSVIANDYLV